MFGNTARESGSQPQIHSYLGASFVRLMFRLDLFVFFFLGAVSRIFAASFLLKSKQIHAEVGVSLLGHK